jgi:hypothetical protein
VVEDVEEMSLLKDYDLEKATDHVTLPRSFFVCPEPGASRIALFPISCDHGPHSALLRVTTVLNLS